MVRNKVAAAMAGAALVVALHGGAASADDAGSRDASGERHNVTVLCTQFGGTMWVDTNGDGTMDYSQSINCLFVRGIFRNE